MEWTGMFIVSLRGVNFRFCSRLGCSGQNVIIFSCQGLVKGCTRRNTVLFICLCYKLVSFRGLHKLWPHPDWSLLGVKFKIPDEHPCPLHCRSPTPLPPPLGQKALNNFKFKKLKNTKTDCTVGLKYNSSIQPYSQFFLFISFLNPKFC